MSRNADEARKISKNANLLKIQVESALDLIYIHASEGEYEAKVIHPRGFRDGKSSLVAERLRMLDFTVDDTEKVDHPDNNHRTIIVTWGE